MAIVKDQEHSFRLSISNRNGHWDDDPPEESLPYPFQLLEQFSKDVREQNRSWTNLRRNMISMANYTNLYRAIVDAAKEDAPGLYELGRRVAKQYLDLIESYHGECSGAMEHLYQRDVETFKMLKPIIATLMQKIHGLRDLTATVPKPTRWLARNIHEIGFAIMASNHELASASWRDESNNTVSLALKAYLGEFKTFSPNCIAFDAQYRFVTSTYARFPKFPPMQNFEKAIRAQRMHPQIEGMMQEARTVLRQLYGKDDAMLSEPEQNEAEGRARGLVEKILGQDVAVAEWGPWWTITGKDRQRKSRCWVCQLLWATVKEVLSEPSSAPATGRTGWDPKYGCQCAETALASRILDHPRRPEEESAHVPAVP